MKQVLVASMLFLSCNNDKGEGTISDHSMESTINPGAHFNYEQRSEYKKGDIVAFTSPADKKVTCLRLVGFPGDKIEIVKGQLLINNQPFNLPNTSTSIYIVKSNKGDFTQVKERFQFKPYSDTFGMVSASKDEYFQITEEKLVDSIYPLGFDTSYIYEDVIKTKSSKHFNHYFFGPIHIPKKGEYISPEDKDLLKGFEPNLKEKFKIEKDYYFLVGDSFSDAMDSRIFGLIPKDKVLGVVNNYQKSKQIHIQMNDN